MKNFEEANKILNDSYANIHPIINDIIEKTCKESNAIIKKIGNDVEKLSKDELRKYILKLSTEIYNIAEVKERATLRQELAEVIHKETLAQNYGNTTGTAKERENKAYLEAINEKLVNLIHSSIESQLKSKISSINIVIENLKSVLISRISEDKNTNI